MNGRGLFDFGVIGARFSGVGFASWMTILGVSGWISRGPGAGRGCRSRCRHGPDPAGPWVGRYPGFSRAATRRNRCCSGQADDRWKRTRRVLRAMTGPIFKSLRRMTPEVESGPSGTVSVWGRGAVTRFDGREGDLAVDGEVASGLFGADWNQGALTAGLLVGHRTGGDPGSNRSACAMRTATPKPAPSG